MLLRRELRQGRPRAYTLVELGVVVVLTTLLIFGMVRWLVSVGASASSGLHDASDSRSALVFDQMAKDVRALQHCQAAGTDARVVNVTTDTMTLILDSDGDGTTETVLWRISGNTIQRGSAAMGADCEPGTVSDWADWLSGADALTFSGFVKLRLLIAARSRSSVRRLTPVRVIRLSGVSLTSLTKQKFLRLLDVRAH